MLQKCANPSCSSVFRRLSDGKLFQVETEYFEKTFRPSPVIPRNKSRRRVEYFWLCGDCASSLSLTFDKTHGIVTVPLPGTNAMPKPSSFAMEDSRLVLELAGSGALKS